MTRKLLMTLALCLTFAAAPGCEVVNFFFAGGSGQVARDNTLLPSMKVAWEGVRKNVNDGIDASSLDATAKDAIRVEVVAFTDALNRADTAAIRSSWAILKPFAQGGIDAAAVGEGVKASLRERVRKFEESVNRL